MKTKQFILILLSVFLMLSCFNPNTKAIQQDTSNHQILTGQIVKKTHVNKAGKTFYYYDLYLRCSVQDYFIKFCESDVTQDEIDSFSGLRADAITVEAEIRDGNWDICPGDEGEIQSRIGEYVVIYKILE